MFFVVSAIGLSGQNFPTANFTLPEEVCLAESIILQNDSEDADHYNWDFCTGDFGFTPTASQYVSSPLLRRMSNIYVYEEGLQGDRYVYFISGIISGAGTREVYRYKANNGFSGPPTLTPILNELPITITRPTDFNVVKVDGSYFGYLIDADANKLYEIPFGNSIENKPSTITDLGGLGLLNQPLSLKAVRQGDRTTILIANFNAQNLSIVTKNSDNTFSSSSINLGNISSDVDLVKVQDKWLAAVTLRNANSIRIIDFGTKISNVPLATYNYNSPVSGPNNAKWAFDGGIPHIIGLTTGGSLFSMAFKDGVSQAPEPLIFGNLGRLSNDSRGLYVVQGTDSKWTVLSSKLTSVVDIITFQNPNPGVASCMAFTDSPTVSYSQPGTFPITLTAIHPNGNRASLTKAITIRNESAPTGQLQAVTQACLSDEISFSFDTEDNINSFLWNFGDGNDSDLQSPEYTYGQSGTFDVTLEIQDNAGCKNTLSSNIHIAAPPEPDFETEFDSYCSFTPITFINLTTNLEDYTWVWGFDGEGQSTGQSPVFSFSSPGLKTIRLTATLGNCSEFAERQIEIIPGPQVDFSFSNACLHTNPAFTNLSSGEDITGYFWAFDNSETSIQENPTTSFTEPGLYDVSFTVSNQQGCENTTTKPIRIAQQIINDILIERAVENIPFTVSADVEEGFSIQQYLWNVGNLQSNLMSPQFTLTEPGSYNLSLVATTDQGCTFSFEKEVLVEVSVISTSDFLVLNDNPCLRETIQFQNESVNADGFQWDFCSGDFGYTPTALQYVSSPLLMRMSNIYVYEEGLEGDRYVFFISGIISGAGTREIYRFKANNGFSDQPTLTPILDDLPITITRPTDFNVVKVDGSYFGYLIDADANKLYEIPFGNSVGNKPSTITDLGGFGLLNQPLSLRAVRDGDKTTILISNFNAQNLSIITKNSDNSFSASSINLGNVASDVDLVKVQGKWLAAVALRNANTIRIFDFGSSITNVAGAIYNYNSPVSGPNHAKWALDGGVPHIIGLTAGGSLFSMAFEGGVSQAPEPLIFGNLGRLSNDSRGLYLVKGADSKWTALATKQTSVVDIITFQNPNPGVASCMAFTENPTASYTQSGTFPISLTAIHPNGNRATIAKEITVRSVTAPTGQLQAVTQACLSDDITFSFGTEDNINSFIWKFGDGSESDQQTIEHTYGHSGTFHMTLEIQSDAGCKNTFSSNIHIVDPPEPDFETEFDSYCSFAPITFSNLTTNLEDYTWVWGFGEEGQSTEQSPVFSFSSPGSKTIRLTATVGNCSELVEKQIEIIPGPQVDFSSSNVCLNTSSAFTNLSTGEDITGYFWDFDNAETSIQENPTTSYTEPGLYDVSFTVSNQQGCENTTTKPIRIAQQIINDILIERAVENIPFTVSADVEEGFSIQQYLWNVGNLQSNLMSPQFTLTEPGGYNLSLLATTDQGCTFSFEKEVMVEVSVISTSDFLVLNNNPCLRETIQFQNESVSADSFQWDFCSGDFGYTPTALQYVSSLLLRRMSNIYVYEEGLQGDRHVFFISGIISGAGTREIYRFKANNGFSGPPTLTPILDDLPITITRPTDLNVVKVDGSYFGYLIDADANKLYEIPFGNSIENKPSNITDLGGFGLLNQPLSLRAVREGDKTTILIANFNAQNLSIVTKNSDNSFSSSSINLGNISSDVDLVKVQDKWLAAVTLRNANTIRIIDFGTNITSVPLATYNYNSPVSGPNNAKWAFDGGIPHIIGLTTGGSLFSMAFKDGVSQAPEPLIFGNLGRLSNDSRGLYVVKGTDSKWTALATKQTSVVDIITFQNPNPGVASCMAFTKNPTVSYSQPGTYPITLTAIHPNGNKSYLTKQITVRPTSAPAFSLSTTNTCLGQENLFAVTSDSPIATYAWDFNNDGTTDSTVPGPTTTFSTAGTYPVKLAIVGANGCPNSIIDSIRIYHPPVPSFAFAGSLLCSDVDITVNNTTTFSGPDSLLRFTWEFEGRTVVGGGQVVLKFDSGGTKAIKLTAAIPGCSADTTRTVQITDAPDVAFTVEDGCQGDVFPFINTTTGQNITNYLWDFGDGSGATQRDPLYSYTEPGQYKVKLEATNAAGCKTMMEDTVQVRALPRVGFIAEIGCVGQPVRFTDTTRVAGANIVKRLWDFGGLGTSTEQNPTFTFSGSGIYPVTLTTISNFGCSEFVTSNVTVRNAPQPEVQTSQACFGDPIFIRDVTPVEPNNAILSRLWQINGQLYQNVSQIELQYQDVQDLEISLTLNYQNLCSSTRTLQVPVRQPILADFENSSVCSNEYTVFTDVSIAPGDSIISRTWDFAGQGVGNGRVAQFAFAVPGTYDVRLTVSTLLGCTATVVRRLTVNPTPVSVFEASATFGPPPLSVNFSSQSVNVAQYEWFVGSNPVALGTEKDFTHVFTELGLFNVRLVVTDVNGCKGQSVQRVRIAIPSYDLSIQDIQAIPNADGTSIVLLIANRGTLDVSNFSFDIKLGSGIVLREPYPFQIDHISNIVYTLNTSLPPLSPLDKICIGLPISYLGYSDLTPINNEACVSFSEELEISDPYPNPTSGNTRIDLILPRAGHVHMEVINMGGAALLTERYFNLRRGLNPLYLDLSRNASGTYLIRFIFEDKVVIKRIVVGF